MAGRFAFVRVAPGIDLQREFSGAHADLRHFRASQLGHAEQQVGSGFLVFHGNVAISLQLAIGASEKQCRHIVPVVRVAVAHAAAKVNQRPIQQRSIAIGRRFQLTDEFGELHRMVRGNPGVLFDVLLLVAVVRYRMVGSGTPT
jgi:hypothetical protein